MTSPRPAALESPLVVASNRGPVSFEHDEGGLVGDAGSGGLVTALAGVLFECDATWLAAAMTDGDRRSRPPETRVPRSNRRDARRSSTSPKEMYDGYYNGLSNRVLWQLHHYLFDLSYLPTLGRGHRQHLG